MPSAKEHGEDSVAGGGVKRGLSAGSSSKDASEEVVCMIIHY